MSRVDLLSVVVPMYNEEAGIAEFCQRLRPVLDRLGCRYEVVFVDDGSSDACVRRVLDEGWAEARVAVLAANVGHQRAIDAGIAEARGDWILTMDADGQHPPDVVEQMVAAARESDVDVVYTRRASRREETALRRSPALAYYRLVRFLTGVPIADSQADFRLMSRSVVRHVEDVKGERILRLLLPATGAASTSLEYVALDRIAGRSRYGLGRQIRMAFDSAFTFSSKPLRMVAAMGWVLSAAAFLWLLGVVITYLADGAVPGWSSVMAAVLLVGGVSLLAQAIIGAYVARIYDIVKGQPAYFVSRRYPEDVDGSHSTQAKP